MGTLLFVYAFGSWMQDIYFSLVFIYIELFYMPAYLESVLNALFPLMDGRGIYGIQSCFQYWCFSDFLLLLQKKERQTLELK